MKLKKCPSCGSSLGDRWCAGRKLQQYCLDSLDNDCTWKAQPRTPERRQITNTKDLRVDNFSGWDYIIYDKFGHESTMSRSYGTEGAARKEMEWALIRGESDVVAGPYTGVLFYTPPTVKLTGKVFKCKSGVVYHHS
jgi:hypothetical protein